MAAHLAVALPGGRDNLKQYDSLKHYDKDSIP